jgi:large subunit ribosomal protein L28
MMLCDICGKTPISGHNVSHSHRKTKRRFLPNLHRKRLTLNGQRVSVKICAQCLKTLSKTPRTKEKAASN